MRILFTTFTFAPLRNGVADAVGAVARGLAARGHEVTVATARESSRAEYVEPGVRIEEFHLQMGHNAPAEVERFQQFVASDRFDVVICHCWRFWNTDLAAVGLRGSKSRSILVSHGYGAHRWIPRRRFAWGLGEWLRGLRYAASSLSLIPLFDHFVFLSARPNADRFIDLWMVSRWRPTAFSVIPNGVPASFFDEASRDLRQEWNAGERCVFLCVSEYHEAKNQELALKAFLQAKTDGVLVFVGQRKNDYSEMLAAMAARSLAGEAGTFVHIIQDPGGDYVRRCYAACDVFVLPSRRETQPLTILQAMASGRPFISTDVGCVRELEGGIVVRSERQMTEAMERVASDPDLRRSLGEKGKSTAEQKHRWEEIVRRYEELCLALTSRSAGSLQS